MEKRKFVYVPINGPIAELNFITGPVGPAYINIDIIKKLIQNGKPVFEVDPNNHSKRIKIDLMNMKDEKFKSVKEPETPVEDSKPEENTVTEKEVVEDTTKPETPADDSKPEENTVTEKEVVEDVKEPETPAEDSTEDSTKNTSQYQKNNKNHKNKRNK